MRTINQELTITAVGPQPSIQLNFDNVQQQININTVFGSFAGTLNLEGNLGMVNPALDQAANAQRGNIVEDPNGWFVISGGTPLNKTTQLGTGQLINFLPMAFVRANIVTGTTGTLTVNLLQQGIRG